jgi:predicted nucleic acid-binding Zn ribbon protein
MTKNERDREYYKIKSLEGMCVYCWTKPAHACFVGCEECLDKRRKRAKALNKKSVARYIRERKCTRCSAPLEEEEYRVCFNCRHKRKGV